MPWGHFAVAFVPYLAYSVGRHRRLPTVDGVTLLAVASQLPDLVDKPFAWWFGLLPSGRAGAHSIALAVLAIAAVTATARHLDRSDLAALFTFGYLSHIYADYRHVAFNWQTLRTDPGQFYYLPNVFWPLVPANPDRNTSVVDHFARVQPTGRVVLLVALAGAAAAFYLHRLRRDRPAA